MPKPDSETDLSFFLHGMEIKMADWLPPGADFAVEERPGRYQFFGLDKGSPDGDHSVVHRITPSIRYSKELLYELDEVDPKIAKRLSMEMQAMREACHMEATRKRFAGITTSNEVGTSPTFRYEDMQRIMKEMSEAERDRKIDQIKTLLKAGFIVKVNEGAKVPIVVLPEEYREAYDEVTKPQPLWPERWTAEMLEDLMHPTSADDWTKQYMGTFGPLPDDEDKETI